MVGIAYNILLFFSGAQLKLCSYKEGYRSLFVIYAMKKISS